MLHSLTIVGVGLIGGSIGLAARRRGLAHEVRGLGRNAASLELARQRGAIDAGFFEPRPALEDANMVVVCTPVDRVAPEVTALAPLAPSECLFTDVGSTKARIVADIEKNSRALFVGSHPLAGSEKRGVEHAEAELFQDRVTVVTPTARTEPAALEKLCAFWRALGSRVKIMDAAEHDRALALTSHLPHLVASALTRLLTAEVAELVATGFRDTTRIAAGAPELWTAIFLHNREALLGSLDALEKDLGFFRGALEDSDEAALRSLFLHAKKVRDALGS